MNIAAIYPLKRLPRRFGFFDYKIPEGMSLQRGNLVVIPFRRELIFGIVAEIKNKPERGIVLKSVTKFCKDFTLKEKELSFFEYLAIDLVQSVASVLYVSIPTPQKARMATNRKFNE